MELENKPIKEIDLSCTFCGPGTWASWRVVTENGVFYACDAHRLEMSKANIIQKERRTGRKAWILKKY
jgi:hypothetical protein